MHHRTTPARCLALLAALALLRPPLAHAAVGPPPTTSQQLAAFEAGFTEGQALLDRGEYLAAARVWISAAGNLSEVTANRDNRLAVYEYVVDAYTRGLADTTEVEPLREAVAALDAYCDGFTRAYGTETPVSPKIVAGLEDLRQRLLALSPTSAAPPTPSDPVEPPPADVPPPARKPWAGLAIGGGVLLGLGVGAVALAAAGGARGNSFEAKFDDPSHACDLAQPAGACAEFYDGGKASNAMAIAGLVAAPLLIGGGVALLVVGLKRRSNARHAISPRFGPGFVGLGVHGRF
jgi:hypothetical protein